MIQHTDAARPAEGRSLALWFAMGTALFALVNWLGAALWSGVVAALVPGATYADALSFPWAIGVLIIDFAMVYGTVLFARHRGAPRWVWLPVGALSAWAAVWGLIEYAVMTVPAATTEGSSASISVLGFASALLFAVSPLLVIALPAVLACLRSGDVGEPLLGDFSDQPRLFAATGVVVAGVGLPLVANAFGWLAGIPAAPPTLLAVPLTLALLVWGLILPALVCWVATKYLRLPQAIWLVIAAGTIAPLLDAQTPGQWSQDPAATIAALVASLLAALLTTGAAILGSWLGSRRPREAQERPAA